MKKISTVAGYQATVTILVVAIWPIVSFLIFIAEVTALTWNSRVESGHFLPAPPYTLLAMFLGAMAASAAICGITLRFIVAKGELPAGSVPLGWASVGVAVAMAACFWVWLYWVSN